MVPLGKATFMPGRLIHRIELLVLLGEGYYAERSAKQAAEILTIRSNFITTKIDALKEQIKDLEAEASFAKETAAEAAGGLVEIREEYTEPSLQPAVETTRTNNSMAFTTVQDDKEMDSDDAHARIMARLAELEMAEEAAEDDEEDNDSEEILETDFRAAFRRSRLLLDEDSDDTEEEDDEKDKEEEDVDSEGVDLITERQQIHSSTEAQWGSQKLKVRIEGRNLKAVLLYRASMAAKSKPGDQELIKVSVLLQQDPVNNGGFSFPRQSHPLLNYFRPGT